MIAQVIKWVLQYWQAALAALGGLAIWFFKWRAEKNKERALRAENKADYLEKKAEQKERMVDARRQVEKKHREEREEIRKKRRKGGRTGLPKW